MPLASPVSTTCVGADDPPAFDPQPIRGDASFGRLLSRRRELDDQRHKGRRLDADDARLLPLMLPLARISARASVRDQPCVGCSGGAQ